MKNLYLPLGLLIILTIACSKENYSPSPVQQEITQEFDIVGIEDTSMSANGFLTLYFGISQIPNTKDSITIAISGVPDSISYTLSKTYDTSSFATILKLDAHDVPEGTYEIQITATKSSKTVTKSFRLTITKAIDCAEQFIGVPLGSRCMATVGNLNFMSSAPPKIYKGDSPNSLLLDLPVLHPIKLPATLDCKRGIITIPSFTYAGIDFVINVSGSGTFLRGELTFTINTVRTGSNQYDKSVSTCTYIGYK